MSTPTRQLPINGGYNYRDLGGYQTIDGHTVKWRRLLRSGSLHHLTSQDLQYLSDLKVAKDIDLRSPHETQKEPDQVPASAEYIANPIFPTDETQSSRPIPSFSDELAVDPTRGRQHMRTVYHEMITEPGPQQAYRDFFQQLLSAPDDRPILFHCTAGKDRTGIGAYLLLNALKVHPDVIIKDYLLTNELVKDVQQDIKQKLTAGHFSSNYIQNSLDMASVKQEYLQTAQDAIQKISGSVERYLKEVMQLSDSDLQVLRHKYRD
ncbi:MAG: tyrosine-protein phosphatase [Lactobacillus sp.]|nr:tyrosine-protein phosphatase [Lactobacillus sp.]